MAEIGQLERNKSKIVYGVDDNPANLAFLESTLLGAGYFFMGFSSGEACISSLWRIRPRLVLLDIQMPGMNGFEVCRRIRSVGDSRDIPIAFLTGLKTRDDVRTGLQAGGNDFIVKPFNPAHLLDRVQHWTSRAGRPAS